MLLGLWLEVCYSRLRLDASRQHRTSVMAHRRKMPGTVDLVEVDIQGHGVRVLARLQFDVWQVDVVGDEPTVSSTPPISST
jgi:hypothetical protein